MPAAETREPALRACPPPPRRWLPPLLSSLLLLLACQGALGAVHLRAATLELPGVSLRDVRMDAQVDRDGLPHLVLDAAGVTVPALGWRDVALSLQGQPRAAAGNAWQFSGRIAARRAPGGALADAGLVIVYDPDGGTLSVDVRQGRTTLHALMPLDQASHVQMELTALPLAWLRGVLAAAWPAGSLGAGSVGGAVALDVSATGTRVSGRVDLSGVDLDSKSGTIAAQKLGAGGSFRIETGPASTNVMFDGVLRGGEVLLGPLYAKLPAAPAELHVAASMGPAGLRVSSFDFDDHDALRASGSVGFGPAGALSALELTRFAAVFPAAYTRYGSLIVEGVTGFSQLTTSGSVDGILALDAGGLRSVALELHQVSVDSHGGSFAIAGADGALDWRAGASRPPTRLGWRGLSLYRIALGPAQLALEDRGGALTLTEPVSVPVAGGSFQLGRFAWQPAGGTGQRLDAAFALSGVELPQLSKAFGWPAFRGTLGGAVPDVSYRDGEVTFAGGLSLAVFDGSVSVTRLSLRDPLGAAPALDADIDLQRLDLDQLTSVFGFGAITGRLDGTIHGLELVGWKPTAFTAQLNADGGGKISQHAIKSLTEVGGGGIAGGLQGMALRLFKTFGYSRIGLSCTLASGVCRMGGITPEPASADGGYTIVAGRGLPLITVIGHERSVDWTTLVSRLKAATEGGGPVVE